MCKTERERMRGREREKKKDVCEVLIDIHRSTVITWGGFPSLDTRALHEHTHTHSLTHSAAQVSYACKRSC